MTATATIAAPSVAGRTTTVGGPSVLIRYMELADEPFVFRTWLETFRKDSLMALPTWQRHEWMDRRVFFAWQHAVVDRLLRGPPGGVVRIACDPAAPDTILGWSVSGLAPEKPGGQPTVPVLHYCYVREPWRKAGIARMLCRDVVDAPLWYCTHRTFFVEPILDRLTGWRWVPWAI